MTRTSMSSLKKRVVTAVILLPVVLGGVIVLPTPYFAVLLALAVLGGAWEWAGLAGWPTVQGRIVYVATFALALLSTAGLALNSVGSAVVICIGLAWWSVALAMVWRYQARGSIDVAPKWLRALVGWLVLLPAWVSMVVLHGHDEQGVYLVLTLLAVIWSADIAAYFVGRRWGRRRLASRVSPGKSLEGVMGGLVAVLATGVVAGIALGLAGGDLWLFLILCLATASISVLGDLAESLFKRQVGLKDSGNLLPGHGGVLDRIDSLTAAAPLFTAGILVILA